MSYTSRVVTIRRGGGNASGLFGALGALNSLANFNTQPGPSAPSNSQPTLADIDADFESAIDAFEDKTEAIEASALPFTDPDYLSADLRQYHEAFDATARASEAAEMVEARRQVDAYLASSPDARPVANLTIGRQVLNNLYTGQQQAMSRVNAAFADAMTNIRVQAGSNRLALSQIISNASGALVDARSAYAIEQLRRRTTLDAEELRSSTELLTTAIGATTNLLGAYMNYSSNMYSTNMGYLSDMAGYRVQENRNEDLLDIAMRELDIEEDRMNRVSRETSAGDRSAPHFLMPEYQPSESTLRAREQHYARVYGRSPSSLAT